MESRRLEPCFREKPKYHKCTLRAPNDNRPANLPNSLSKKNKLTPRRPLPSLRDSSSIARRRNPIFAHENPIPLRAIARATHPHRSNRPRPPQPPSASTLPQPGSYNKTQAYRSRLGSEKRASSAAHATGWLGSTSDGSARVGDAGCANLRTTAWQFLDNQR